MGDNRDALLTDWRNSKKKLDVAKAEEAALRPQVIDAFSEIKDENHTGTETVNIGWGHELKVTHALSYTLDEADNSAKIDAALDRIEREVEGGKLLSERLVTWKPQLNIGEYKKLPPQARKIIDRVLTIKPKAKTVEIKPVAGADKS